jgi:phosphotransferase system enzyme I (PtsI)
MKGEVFMQDLIQLHHIANKGVAIGTTFVLTPKDVKEKNFGNITKGSILVAHDLGPSDIALMDMTKVLGFVTLHGGVTSHVSIVAKNVGLPAAVGVSDVFDAVRHGDEIILDCIGGEIKVRPDDFMLWEFREKMDEYNRLKVAQETDRDKPAITRDGRTITVHANAGTVQDAVRAIAGGAEGIGLYRTEFSYMLAKTGFPAEDDLYEEYRDVVLAADGRPVTIRTLDISADKNLPYFTFTHEANPMMGWRAIRMCLGSVLTGVFHAQIRAILRAAAHGKVRIMLPMIISVKEFEEVRAEVEICKNELQNEGISIGSDVEVGVMIETPAAAIMSPELAQVAAFFSIGTNDLTQYMLAVDRGNEKVAHLYDSKNPAVLRAIKVAIDAGNAAGIPVGMCGEFASQPDAIPLLLELGLTEFSVGAAFIGEVKNHIRSA